MKNAKIRLVNPYIIHTGRYRVSHDTWYCSMFKRSTAQHATAAQGKARRRTAPHSAALLNYNWAELSCEGMFFVIQHTVPGT